MNFKDFFEKATLNEQITTISIGALDIENYNHVTFANPCPRCETITTFQTEIETNTVNDHRISEISKSKPSYIGDNGTPMLGFAPTTHLVLKKHMYYIDKENNRFIDFSFTTECTCQQCKKHFTYFLISVQGETLLNNFIIGEEDCFDKSLFSNLVICKRGVYPVQDLKLNKTVQKFLDRESDGWYYRLNKCINSGLGIGAYAYCRRIVEKELLHIAKFVKENSKDEDRIKIEEILDSYNKDQKANVLYENIFHYLPSSIKHLGNNPLEILYKTTSKGLHELTEDKCLEDAKKMNTLLEFVIEKLYEERDRVSSIKSILKEF